MNLLSLEQAQKSYGEKVLLKQANFYLNEGEKVGIIGINGTGKTTLLRILAGTEVPDEGSRTVANHVVLHFLEQNPQMPADMSVLEYVLQGEKEEDRWILEPDAKTLLMTFELNDFNQPCGQLSGGQKKRAALAKTLLRPADILILDEPTRGIDIGTKTEIQKLVLRLADEGKSIAFISSEVEEMLRTCSRMAVLRDGKKVGEIEGDDLTQEKIMDTIAGGGKSNE